MLHKPVITYIFVFFILLNIQTSYGQLVNFKTNSYWVDIGIGSFNSFKDSGGLHANISINLSKNKNIYKLQYQENFHLFSRPLPNEELHSFNLLAGKQLSLDGLLYIQFLTGVGTTYGTLRGNILIEKRKGMLSSDVYNTERVITPSIPIETELVFKPIKYAQIGVSLFGNINLKRPFYGFAVKAGIGKVR